MTLGVSVMMLAIRSCPRHFEDGGGAELMSGTTIGDDVVGEGAAADRVCTASGAEEASVLGGGVPPAGGSPPAGEGGLGDPGSGGDVPGGGVPP